MLPEPVPNQLNSESENENTKLDQHMNLLMEKLRPLVADKLKNDPNLKALG